jgi:ribosome modulation factor
MAPQESAMYDLGRQARQAGFAKECCNLPYIDVRRAWWLAGWHDLDMEKQHQQTEEQNNELS